MKKHIAIIGGSTGIGAALIRSLHAQGHALYVANRTPQAQPEGIHSQHFDATSPTPLHWPDQLDGLVYCPGTITLKPFHRTTAEDFTRDLQVNLLGAVHALQSALPALKTSPSASVVLFSTVAVAQGMPFHASISAAKGAVEALAKSLAAELAPRIRVNVIAPSLTETPLATSLLSDETKKAAAAKRHPLNRVGDADSTAALAEFLLGDNAAFITGQILRPDGGLSAVRLFS